MADRKAVGCRMVERVREGGPIRCFRLECDGGFDGGCTLRQRGFSKEATRFL